MRLLILFLTALLPALAADPFTARVVSVHDSDTITVEAAGRVIRVRLFGIDSPEAKQDSGPEATWFTTSAAMDRTVIVTPHDTDRYGRMVAEVTLPDGRSLSKALVTAGWAWWYAQYAPKAADLQTEEAYARAHHTGLWADSNPLPPWEWREGGYALAASQSRARLSLRSKRRDTR